MIKKDSLLKREIRQGELQKIIVRKLTLFLFRINTTKGVFFWRCSFQSLNDYNLKIN